ncbi:MAG: DUF1211 domain-containing protein [Candidatus Eisenbacteria bacterium]|uniref:DUF1211 domain-containing protein n=1 Tax=Eiseniibacteriota bacterium TaxID=2212470 RepID=A0A956LVM8_UNCEI|nr:DUF1211 domain-containing protein [Candidatus Eisenbacteria bacterium]
MERPIGTLFNPLAVRGDRHFRWRGGDISRIEAFSDAVFAFAITLLVVSLDVPTTFDELTAAMRGFVAFGLCFALLVYIWYNHFLFFRRYGFEDPSTVALNGVLLFVVLFYVYPLKFVWVFLTRILFGVESGVETVIVGEQMRSLMLIYSGGFLALFLLLATLFHRAYRKRDVLALDPLEVHMTVTSIGSHLIQAGVAAISIGIVVFGGHPAISGVIYAAIGPLVGIHAAIRARRQDALLALRSL